MAKDLSAIYTEELHKNEFRTVEKQKVFGDCSFLLVRYIPNDKVYSAECYPLAKKAELNDYFTSIKKLNGLSALSSYRRTVFKVLETAQGIFIIREEAESELYFNSLTHSTSISWEAQFKKLLCLFEFLEALQKAKLDYFPPILPCIYYRPDENGGRFYLNSLKPGPWIKEMKGQEVLYSYLLAEKVSFEQQVNYFACRVLLKSFLDSPNWRDNWRLKAKSWPDWFVEFFDKNFQSEQIPKKIMPKLQRSYKTYKFPWKSLVVVLAVIAALALALLIRFDKQNQNWEGAKYIDNHFDVEKVRLENVAEGRSAFDESSSRRSRELANEIERLMLMGEFIVAKEKLESKLSQNLKKEQEKEFKTLETRFVQYMRRDLADSLSKVTVLAENQRYDQALKIIDSLKRSYPEGDFMNRIIEAEDSVEEIRSSYSLVTEEKRKELLSILKKDQQAIKAVHGYYLRYPKNPFGISRVLKKTLGKAQYAVSSSGAKYLVKAYAIKLKYEDLLLESFIERSQGLKSDFMNKEVKPLFPKSFPEGELESFDKAGIQYLINGEREILSYANLTSRDLIKVIDRVVGAYKPENQFALYVLSKNASLNDLAEEYRSKIKEKKFVRMLYFLEDFELARKDLLEGLE